MSGRRVRELAQALTKGFVRDRSQVFFTIAFPLIFLLGLGALFGDDETRRIEVYVSGSGSVVDTLPSEVLDIERVDDVDEAIENVREGDRQAVIVEDGTSIEVYFAASDPAAAGTVRGIVDSVVNQANLSAVDAEPRFELRASQVEDESLSAVEFLTPGLLGWAVSVGGVFTVALTLVTWRDKGLLRRLRLAPVRVSEISAARIGVSLAVALVQAALFLAVGVWLLGLDLSSSWWMAFPLIIAGTLALLSIGLLVGALVKTVEAATAIANLITIGMAMISGAFFPFEAAPAWLNVIAEALPLKHLLDALKDVMIRGDAPVEVLPAIAVMVGFAVVVGAAAARVFRWQVS